MCRYWDWRMKRQTSKLRESLQAHLLTSGAGSNTPQPGVTFKTGTSAALLSAADGQREERADTPSPQSPDARET
eukprot:gene3409-53089_t